MKKTASWGIVIVMLYFLPLIGIIMLVHKVSAERWRMKENGKAMKILGLVVLCFVPICVILGVTGSLEIGADMTRAAALGILIFIFGAMGLALYLPGRKLAIRGQKYDHYIFLLPSRLQISLEEIAMDQKLSCKHVSDDIQSMIQNGYLQDACIDPVNRILIMKQAEKKIRHFICPHCNGRNSLDASAPLKCQYCDSVIE